MEVTFLLDVNVLLALADSRHVFHRAVHKWLPLQKPASWASCPITENGFVRILSQPAYGTSRKRPQEAIALLREMKRSGAWKHTFWSDDYSITEAAWVNSENLASHGQIADVYLAALALRMGGKLATFDRSVAWQCVPGATSELVEVIPG